MPQSTLTTLPTEIVEKIALCLSPEDLLQFRLSNTKLAEKSFDAFTAYFLSNMT